MDFYFPNILKKITGCFKGTEGLFYSHAGKIYYVYAGKGENVLLLHNLGPGMSSYEWCENFEELSHNFRVFAVDMPGYARSDKNTYLYTAPLYISFIKDFIMRKIKSPVYIVTSGISANYGAMAAYSMPDLVKGIIMSSPVTSVRDYGFFNENAGKDKFKNIYCKYISANGLKDFASSCVSVNAADNIHGMFDEMCRCAEQTPFAEYAAGSYISGYSNFSCQYVLEKLCCPVKIIQGAKTPEKTFGCTVKEYKKMLSPHIEDSQKFNDEIRNIVLGA